MNLSPLRKEVQQLNKDLESQNIQIKDLIKFLNKSTPTQTLQKHQSPRSNLKRILQLKDCFSEDKIYKGTDQKKLPIKQFRQSKSMKYLRPFQPIKSHHESSTKYLTTRQVPMAKSITFHNIQNAITTRKYLKLSRPEKKRNSSCSFCRQTTFGSNKITDCSKIHKVSSRAELQTKLTQSKHVNHKAESMMKKSTQSKRSRSKQKITEKANSDKKTPLRELGSNQILSKHEVKSFLEKKSIKPGNQQTKSKAQLLLKNEKPIKNPYLSKK